MKQIFRYFRNCFQSKLARLFFAANLIFCGFAFDWSNLLKYLGEINDSGCRRMRGLDLTLYGFEHGYSPEAAIYVVILTLIIIVIFLIFFLPSYVVAISILQVLKESFPGLCPETLQLLSIPIFAPINACYWILLGYFIESIHAHVLRNKTARKNPLSIYSKDD